MNYVLHFKPSVKLWTTAPYFVSGIGGVCNINEEGRDRVTAGRLTVYLRASGKVRE